MCAVQVSDFACQLHAGICSWQLLAAVIGHVVPPLLQASGHVR